MGAQDLDVVFQTQPPVLDVELEVSTNDSRIEFNLDTVFNVSGCTSKLDLWKEWKFSINTDGDGLLNEVDHDDDLQNLM